MSIYRHNITPFEGVPVLEGDEAKRFNDICENNSKHFASSEYDKGRDAWVKNILSKKHPQNGNSLGDDE